MITHDFCQPTLPFLDKSWIGAFLGETMSARRFRDLDPNAMPAVLVANHGPFTWGKDSHDSVKNAVVLEEVAAMGLGTMSLNPEQPGISRALLDKHYLRKHGRDAYYGQE